MTWLNYSMPWRRFFPGGKMKSKVLLAIASGWVLCNNVSVFAQQAAGASPEQSAPINGSATFTLKPTEIAPAGTGGSAALEGNTLTLHLSHLGPGRYDLVGVRRTDGVRERLGD